MVDIGVGPGTAVAGGHQGRRRVPALRRREFEREIDRRVGEAAHRRERDRQPFELLLEAQRDRETRPAPTSRSQYWCCRTIVISCG